MFRKTLAVALAAAATMGVAACGDDDDDSGDGQAGAPTATEPAITTGEDTGGTTAGGGTTFTIAADPGGQLAYDKKTATVKAGKVTIDFSNPSPTPHDVKLEAGGEDVAETETISDGETTETATLEPGEYTFYCSVGNHRQAGMEGTLTAR